MNPEQVMALQRQLQAGGLYNGPVDGKLGPATQKAIEAQQARQNIAGELEKQRLQTEGQRLQLQSEEGRRQAQREENAPGRQALDAAKFFGPLAAGVGYGYRQAKKIETRQSGMSLEAQRSMSLGRRVAPHLAKSMTYFVPEGLGLRYMASQMPEGATKDLTAAGGTGLLAAGLGTAGEGIVRALTPKDVPGAAPPAVAPPAPSSLPPPPDAPPSPSQPGPRSHSDRMIAAAKAAGGKGIDSKSAAAKYLTPDVIDANRMAIAGELGVNSGPNFTKRLGQAAKRLASKPGAFGVALPVAGAALAYDAAQGGAEAAGMTSDEARRQGMIEGGATGAGLAAGAYGIPKAMGAIASYAPGVARAAGRVLPPVAAGLTAYDVGSSIAGGLGNAENAQGADFAIRGGNLPFQMRQQQQENIGYGPQGNTANTPPVDPLMEALRLRQMQQGRY